MTPTEALASALRQSGITPPPHEVNTGEVMARILLANLPEGWVLVHSPGLLEHERHAALGENHWFSCEWCDDEADE